MTTSDVRAVFLDRDGVLNQAVVRDGKPLPPAAAAEMRLLPGVPRACAYLKRHGFVLIVVTNQPDIARGTVSADVVGEINAALRSAVEVDDIRVCPHDDTDGCGCRKPAPGLLTRAAYDHHISLSDSFMVGDRWRDVEAGRRAGCRTVFIDHGYDEPKPQDADRFAADLPEAAKWIVRVSSPREAELRAR